MPHPSLLIKINPSTARCSLNNVLLPFVLNPLGLFLLLIEYQLLFLCSNRVFTLTYLPHNEGYVMPLHTTPHPVTNQPAALILVGGFGTRLRPLVSCRRSSQHAIDMTQCSTGKELELVGSLPSSQWLICMLPPRLSPSRSRWSSSATGP